MPTYRPPFLLDRKDLPAAIDASLARIQNITCPDKGARVQDHLASVDGGRDGN